MMDLDKAFILILIIGVVFSLISKYLDNNTQL